jgi:hypothetical protein
MKSLYLLLFTALASAQDCLDSPLIRRIPPSTADPSNPNPPYITVNYFVYSSDVPHLVIPPSESDTILKVFLPGTAKAPQEASCLLTSIGSTTIGLSYAFLDSSDAARNEACAARHGYSGKPYQNCLVHQHVDAVWGGLLEEPGLWQFIDRHDSIEGRLTALLQYLHEQYPTEGWDNYIRVVPGHHDQTSPNWDRIWILGHSQGAGHAGFLAQSIPLAGAGLLSGPQDDCGSDDCWISEPWETSDVRVFAHAGEGAINIITENWKRMNVFESTEPSVDSLIPGRPWITSLEPQANAICTPLQANHRSVALDFNAPIETTAAGRVYVYSEHVWPMLAGM